MLFLFMLARLKTVWSFSVLTDIFVENYFDCNQSMQNDAVDLKNYNFPMYLNGYKFFYN